MTIPRRPRVARLADTAMQRLSAAAESHTRHRFRDRLPEFGGDREVVTIMVIGGDHGYDQSDDEGAREISARIASHLGSAVGAGRG